MARPRHTRIEGVCITILRMKVVMQACVVAPTRCRLNLEKTAAVEVIKARRPYTHRSPRAL